MLLALLLFLPLCSAQVYLWVGEPTNVSTGIPNMDLKCSIRMTGARALLCTPTLDVKQFFGESYDVQTRTNTSGWNASIPIARAGNVSQTLFTSGGLGGTIRDWNGTVVVEPYVMITSCSNDGTKILSLMCDNYTNASSYTMLASADRTSSWVSGSAGNKCNTTYRTYCIGGDFITPDPFIFKWNVPAGVATLPSTSPGLLTDWGDTTTNNLTTHNYTSAGVYTVTITGNMEKVRFSNPEWVTDIVSWGSGFYIGSNDTDMFAGCSNLRNITANPSSQPVFLPNATLKGMFRNSSFNSQLSWDLTNVISLDYMFADTTLFNQPIQFRNTQKVTSMVFMFSGAQKFNQFVNFSTTSVQHMEYMFAGASEFNQPITFGTQSVMGMDSMFDSASNFNQPVNLDTGNVVAMTRMFRGASSFNQPIIFNGTSLVNSEFMFANATALNSSVTLTSTSSLDTCTSMFEGVTAFNQPVTVTTVSVTSMASMFKNAVRFNQPVIFDTGKVVAMTQMFWGAISFNQVINFNGTSLVNSAFMFANATAFNSPITLTSTSSLDTCTSMFEGALAFNQPITFTTVSVTGMASMFRNAVNFNQLVNFDTGKVVAMTQMFWGAISFNQAITFNGTSLTNSAFMFAGATAFNSSISITSPTPNWNTARGMFQGATSFNQPVLFDTSQLVAMDSMFEDASSFNQPVNFNTTNAEVLLRMFTNASSFNQTVNFSSVARATNMSQMFWNVSSGFVQDLSSWNTSAVGNCAQFCDFCGLPAFPQCQPCSSSTRQYRGNLSVCNCPANGCGSSARPSSSFVLTPVNQTNGTATVFLPPIPIFQNGTVAATIDPGSNSTLSSVVSLDVLDENGQKVNVTNLTTPFSIVFQLKIPIDPSPVAQCLGAEFVVAPVLPTCSYLEEESGKWLTDGCSVAGFNATHVQCNCTHFTLFAVISPKHHALVPSEILNLTPANISANPTGLVTVIFLLCFFAILFVVAALIDRVEAMQYEQLRLSKQEKWKNFAADQKKTTYLKQVKLAFQKRHTWFSMVFRKSGTSFRSVDRTFVTMLLVFVSMSMSAFYHAQDNNRVERIGVILISVSVCFVSSQLLTQLFVRTGALGFYEEWEQSTEPPRTNKFLNYRFPDQCRHVWRAATLISVVGMIVAVLTMSMNFDRQPLYYCRGEGAGAWVSTWLAAYAFSIFLIEPFRIVLFVSLAYYKDRSRVRGPSMEMPSKKTLDEEEEEETNTEKTE